MFFIQCLENELAGNDPSLSSNTEIDTTSAAIIETSAGTTQAQSSTTGQSTAQLPADTTIGATTIFSSTNVADLSTIHSGPESQLLENLSEEAIGATTTVGTTTAEVTSV